MPSPPPIESLVEKWRNWNSTAMTPLTCADELSTLLQAHREVCQKFYEEGYGMWYADDVCAKILGVPKEGK